jgi:hypothetical protein
MIKLNYDKEKQTASIEIDGKQEDIMEELVNASLDVLENFEGDDPLLDFIKILVNFKNEIEKEGVVM